MVTLPFILFELFPLELCASQKPCPLYNLENGLSYIHETLYMYQPTCVDVQSARTVTLSFILFELFPLELCQSQKTIIYDYFTSGFDIAIVNYIDRYLY